MTSLERLGGKLRAARKKKGLTQQKLADLSHVSLKHIQNCERGKKNPSFEILQALAKVLDISLDSLLAPDMLEDEQAANEMRQIYLSCPPCCQKGAVELDPCVGQRTKRYGPNDRAGFKR